MKEFIDKLIRRLEEAKESAKRRNAFDSEVSYSCAIEIVNKLAEEFAPDISVGTNVSEMPTGWIPCSERLPECENKYGWVSCIVSVIRSHYPTSTYDVCDAPYDENIVMHANYHVSQKIWHLECDEQLNALLDIEDAPLNCDYVVAWMPLPAPYTEGE